jgi:uncharacterized membrane protein YdjX (TVP38/TMEM64 family)
MSQQNAILPNKSAPAADADARAIVRPLVLGLVLAGAAAAFYFSPLRPWLGDTGAVRRTLASLGAWAYPSCVLGVAVLVACGAPRLVLTALGAMVLGFWWGLALTQLGALVGYYGVFLFVRWGGRDWVMRRWPRLCRWAGLIQDQGVMGVLLMRQLPAHGTLINLCLGLSGVKHRDFLIGSAIGILPEAVPVALIGAGLVRSSFRETVPYLVAATVALAAIWIGCARALRRRSLRGGVLTSALAAQVTAANGVTH